MTASKKFARTNDENLLNNKKNIAVQSILVAVTVILSVLSSIYLVRGSLAQARKTFSENAFRASANVYSALPLSLKDGNTADAFDAKMSISDETYSGIVSQDSVIDVKTSDKKGKVKSTVAFVYDDRLKLDDLFIKDEKVDIPTGYYPIYVAGYEWSDIVTGDMLKLILPSSTGEVLFNVIVAGKFDYSRLIGTIVSGRVYYDAYRSFIGIVGVDLKTLYPNSDKYIYAFTKQLMKDVVSDTSYGVKGGTSPMVLQSMQASSQISDFSSTDGFIYKEYTCFIIFTLVMVAVLFIGNKYRVFHYIIYGVLSAITMVIYYIVSVKTAATSFIEKPLAEWFTIFFVIQIIVPLLIAVIIQFLSMLKQKRTKEVQCDNIKKYL